MRKVDLKNYAHQIADALVGVSEDDKTYFMKNLRANIKPQTTIVRPKRSNPYIDFVKEYRQSHPNLSGRELITQASTEWGKMKK